MLLKNINTELQPIDITRLLGNSVILHCYNRSVESHISLLRGIANLKYAVDTLFVLFDYSC